MSEKKRFELWLTSPERIHNLMKSDDRQSLSVSEYFISTVLKTRVDDFSFNRIYKNDHGKPILSDSSLSFNISHSNEYLAMVLCEQKFCGVDIQVVEKRNRFEDALKSVLTDKEFAYLETQGSDESFFRLWSLKEAYIKAIGSSIWYGRDYDFTSILDEYCEQWTFCNNLFLYSTEIYKGVYLSISVPESPGVIDYKKL